jgi:hypothetical protein
MPLDRVDVIPLIERTHEADGPLVRDRVVVDGRDLRRGSGGQT